MAFHRISGEVRKNEAHSQGTGRSPWGLRPDPRAHNLGPPSRPAWWSSPRRWTKSPSRPPPVSTDAALALARRRRGTPRRGEGCEPTCGRMGSAGSAGRSTQVNRQTLAKDNRDTFRPPPVKPIAPFVSTLLLGAHNRPDSLPSVGGFRAHSLALFVRNSR